MIDKNIQLKEWETLELEGVFLQSKEERNTVELLKEKRILEILELRDGIRISSNSYVGRIKLGGLQISVSPKINGIPLYKLLKYAFGLREIKPQNMAEHSIESLSFFDLIIYELYLEAEDLLHRGIQKSYIPNEEDLASPRGKVNINKISSQGGLIKDKLPCKYFSREENNILNKVLLAGLKLGLELVLDVVLKVKLQRICSNLEESIEAITLTRMNLQHAKNSINRLTGRYSAAIEIINLLYESQGVQLETNLNTVKLRGYFFDMNVFFEKLVGRLLSNYGGKYSVKDQFSLNGMFIYRYNYNPRRRKSPTPRPDFALMENGKIVRVMDAKYRDLWENSLPRDMLYQLAMYAVSDIGDNTATILYPAINDIPRVQKIDVKHPTSSSIIATVILKPINLMKVSECLRDGRNDLNVYIKSLLA